MHSGISTLLDNTVSEVVDVIGGFITDGHLGTLISVALAIGVISFVVYRLVRKY